MLALRLARGSHPLVLLRRLLLTAAATGTGFLLLCALGHATAHPTDATESLVRLLWCAVPLAATVHLSVAVARTDPAACLQRGMTAAGLGPVRLTLLAASSTTAFCVLGCLLALAAFLHLRGGLGTAPAGGDAAQLLGGAHPLTMAGALTLLGAVPLSTAAATAVAVRPRRSAPARSEAAARAEATAAARSTNAVAGVPWAIALTATGLALEAYASRGAVSAGPLLPLPGRLVGSPSGVLAGWALCALGLVLAGPGLTQLSGRLLGAGRPGALRLLAGRVLQDESRRIGRPLGVLCAVASGACTALRIYGASPTQPFGPLTGIGAALVLMCATAGALSAALEARSARTHTTVALRRLGAPASVLHRAAALRAAALLIVMAPMTCAVAELAALPLMNR